MNVNFKKWWKKLKGWQKSGVIGFLIGLIIIIGMLFSIIIGFNLLRNFFMYLSIPAVLLSGPLSKLLFYIPYFESRFKQSCTGEGAFLCPLIIGMIFLPFIYGAIGMIVGIILQKFKK